MMGVELVLPGGAPDGAGAIALVQQALGDGLLILADSPTANVLSFTPPFDISDEEIAFVVDWLRRKLT
jgi:4-aminobutyrate aminotransferase-like enzyme